MDEETLAKLATARATELTAARESLANRMVKKGKTDLEAARYAESKIQTEKQVRHQNAKETVQCAKDQIREAGVKKGVPPRFAGFYVHIEMQKAFFGKSPEAIAYRLKTPVQSRKEIIAMVQERRAGEINEFRSNLQKTREKNRERAAARDRVESLADEQEAFVPPSSSKDGYLNDWLLWTRALNPDARESIRFQHYGEPAPTGGSSAPAVVPSRESTISTPNVAASTPEIPVPPSPSEDGYLKDWLLWTKALKIE